MDFTRDSSIFRLIQYFGLADISALAKTLILSALVGVDKTLLYSLCIQTTCARKHNKPSQDNYFAATLAGAVS